MTETDRRLNPARRVTVRDIARSLGIHFTTVAEALRGSARISKETSRKVHEAARQMNYRPDPVLAALNAYRTAKKDKGFQGALAWVYGHPKRDFFLTNNGFYNDCWQRVQERAGQYGYKVDEIWTGASGFTDARAVEILKARNVAGLLIAPQPLGLEQIKFPWDQFCAVRIGYSIQDVSVPIISPDQFYNSSFLYEKLVQMGFKRIGFACPTMVDRRVNYSFSGGYLSARQRYTARKYYVPLFSDANPHADGDAFVKWYLRYRPEAVMAVPGSVYQPALLKAGVRIPEDVCLGSLSIVRAEASLCGIDECGDRVGETAVDILVNQINLNALGQQPYQRTTLVRGDFVMNGNIPLA